jgi:7-carboxy-7-deazaguanine synthase
MTAQNQQTSLPSTSLPLMEHFYTIQGEGFHSGRAAYFLRLGGCDVGCVWCDVKESWNAAIHPFTSVTKMVDAVLASPANFVVITGGEPGMYDLTDLVDTLHHRGKEVAIETSGVYAFAGNVDWYCFSPKKFKAPHPEAYSRADELKVVISHPSDFEWAEGHALKVGTKCKLFLQPEWSKQERFLPEIIDYVKKNPQWRVSLQTHKYMNIP